jgi:UDP-3-O-acyl N-acetylglucosamine deacetylase
MSSDLRTNAAAVPSKTVSRRATLSGIGLHSGKEVHVTLCPAPATLGIRFIRTDLSGSPEVAVQDVDENAPPFRSAIRRGAAEVHTVEHLLSAFAGLGITDCRVEIDGLEVPGMDGSAQDFLQAIKQAGIQESSASTPAIVVEKEIVVEDGIARIVATPGSEKILSIDYTLDYPGIPLAQGRFKLELTPENFEREIAAARTFAPRKDAEAMRAAGLGKGANTQNTVIIDGDRIVDTKLRFSDEPVRHKILDLIGDLYLLGRPVFGHIEARCSGHKANRELAKRLR